ncbi:hypothetical protein BDV38DRAFT_283971 [Aspergillus pseudotamarii]|uniref:Uncharacterized protein n=1 Tax=Aspergillus pseudotamarii TaxID=132259 RepID=A0A5N6SP70_ASPPS|nr:uncharacterized protein BDV38DRAFT_283971 [Aspergillus pseudotamarii]KAE8136486.1 hypothetical protein BDV38DRAFT_283971 [Aspergillus pseudotamarii]
MTYKFVLCFGKITFGKRLLTSFVYPNRQGIWLQRSPENNLLALLAVSHLVYDEARRVLYSLNSFIFRVPEKILVFLIDIGRDNAALLQLVQWMNGPQHSENQIGFIKRYLTWTEEEHIWNDEGSYLNFLATLNKPPRDVIATQDHRLVRLDTDCTSLCGCRVRYRMGAIFGDNDGEVSNELDT